LEECCRFGRNANLGCQQAAFILIFTVYAEKLGFVSTQTEDKAISVRIDLEIAVGDAAGQFFHFD
jgi:hypothetical protein